MVDDSAADRRLCRILLEEIHGPQLEFFEASQIDEAIEACRKEEPDCVLLDYNLSEMTGVEFLERLRAGLPESEPEFGVVLLTGWASEQVAVEAMRAGVHDYLVKGRITADGLNLTIQNAVHKVGLTRALREERDRLSRSLAEKEVLLKEVHHRVKNNLQVIASLLRLQAGAFDNPDLSAALRDSQHRVESMAMIHEQLYESGDLREVDLAKNTRQLLANLFESYGVDPGRISGEVAIPLEGSPALVLGVDQAIPAGLILNELISNALKHAFPGGRRGSIRVEGERRHGTISLAVRDDGVGAPAKFDKGKSLGLEIVRILTRQLRGELDVERGAGTTFRVTFPERQG